MNYNHNGHTGTVNYHTPKSTGGGGLSHGLGSGHGFGGGGGARHGGGGGRHGRR